MEGMGKCDRNTESTITKGEVALKNDRPVFLSDRALHMDRTIAFKQEEISGHEPQMGFDTKTDRLTDRQLQCEFDFDKRG
jgi:hypothetical protein